MKTAKRTTTIGLSLLILINLNQTAGAQDVPGNDQWGDWTVVSREESCTTRERVTAAAGSNGTNLALEIHRIVEVATGLNFMGPDGQYRESKELIELTVDGGAAAINGQLKAKFSQAAVVGPLVTLTTKSNHTIKIKPFSISYVDDKSGQRVLLSKFNDAAVMEL